MPESISQLNPVKRVVDQGCMGRPAINERAFQQQILDLARLNGFYCYHTFDSRRSQPGFPDLVLVRGRRLIFAELKTATSRLTHDQRTWVGALRATLAEVYVWRPDDWDHIVATLSR